MATIPHFPATLSIIACHASKRPVGPWKAAQTSIHPLAAPAEAYGVVCGRVSHNLECIDYDAKNDPHPELTIAAFEQLVYSADASLYDKLVIQRTPSGGLHYLYRTETPPPSQHIISRAPNGGPLYETRGEGGYFITHAAGYTLIQGTLQTLASITDAQRGILMAAAQALGEPPAEAEPRQVAEAADDAVTGEGYNGRNGLSPLDDYDRRGDVMELLQRHGWRQLYTDARGVVYLCRPGKAAGISATFNHRGRGRLFVFTTSVPELPANRSYKPSSLYGLLDHGGDFKAAARALRAAGYGDPPAATMRDIDGTPLDETFVLNAAYNAADGDSVLLDAILGRTVCYDRAAKLWAVYDAPQAPGHWGLDDCGYIYRLAIRTLVGTYTNLRSQMDAELATIANVHGAQPSPDQLARANELQRHTAHLSRRITECRKLAHIRSVLELYRSLPNVAVSGDIWDRHAHLLGTPNGVIDLQTGALVAAEPSMYIRRTIPTEYHPDGVETCDVYDQFLVDVFGDELFDYIKRLIGYLITGETREHIFVVFYGPDGRNGKDTLINLLYAVLGRDIAKAVSPDVMITAGKAGGGATPELYDLLGVRLGVVNESEEHARAKVAQIKALSGGTVVKARPLFGHYLEFTPTHKLVLVTNHRPTVPAHEEALWARMHVVPFTRRFVDNPRLPNERLIDRDLPRRLMREREAILRALVAGAVAYYQQGLADRPASMLSAVGAYRADMDTVGQFIDERCTISEGASVPKTELWRAYASWCTDNALMAVSRPRFHEAILGRGCVEARFHNGQNVRCFRGIELSATTLSALRGFSGADF